MQYSTLSVIWSFFVLYRSLLFSTRLNCSLLCAAQRDSTLLRSSLLFAQLWNITQSFNKRRSSNQHIFGLISSLRRKSISKNIKKPSGKNQPQWIDPIPVWRYRHARLSGKRCCHRWSGSWAQRYWWRSARCPGRVRSMASTPNLHLTGELWMLGFSQ